ncbi:MAG: hypothetical protein E5W82_10490 [Mesorhizobium sp.]|nr:MAG: hypothetical protein E5W82_10490 [Mesorhizobium sp.]
MKNTIRFTLGMVAAIADDFDILEVRNKIINAVQPNGRTADGFDFVADRLSMFRRWKKRWF